MGRLMSSLAREFGRSSYSLSPDYLFDFGENSLAAALSEVVSIFSLSLIVFVISAVGVLWECSTKISADPRAKSFGLRCRPARDRDR